jgi:hypothetical protein
MLRRRKRSSVCHLKHGSAWWLVRIERNAFSAVSSRCSYAFLRNKHYRVADFAVEQSEAQ